MKDSIVGHMEKMSPKEEDAFYTGMIVGMLWRGSEKERKVLIEMAKGILSSRKYGKKKNES